MNLRRRALLAGVGLAGLLPNLFGRWTPAAETAPTSVTLLAGLAGRADAVAVGRAYLSQAGHDGSAAALSADLMRELGTDAQTSNARLNRRINDLCRRDFAAGNVVSIDGWLLARTEAGLCILAALVDANAAGTRYPA